MGIFSEVATEGTIKEFVREIAKDLKANEDKPEVCAALKKIGRFALTQFEWNTPAWAAGYKCLFRDECLK